MQFQQKNSLLFEKLQIVGKIVYIYLFMTMTNIPMYAKYILSLYQNIFVEIACHCLYRYRSRSGSRYNPWIQIQSNTPNSPKIHTLNIYGVYLNFIVKIHFIYYNYFNNNGPIAYIQYYYIKSLFFLSKDTHSKTMSYKVQ